MDKNNLDRLVKEGWLISQVHPSLDLTIYNYSQKTQYEKYWTEETLSCRGLVMDSKGNIVARPFKKFFNLSEIGEAPDLPFEVFEKMDGSLGIFFYYRGNPVFASRGSFTSEQSQMGWKMIEKMGYELLKEGITYMFEIIYPSNMIVVNYGTEEKLVLLGAIDTQSGVEIPYSNLLKDLSKNFEVVKKWDNKTSIEEITKENIINREGYVLKFSDSSRVKVKFEEYCRLHRIITNVSNLNIWEKLRSGSSLDDILDKVPDEFYDWVRETEESLTKKFHKLLKESNEKLILIKNRLENSERKVYAEEIKKEDNSKILFYLLDGKNPDQLIWKEIKPKWEKPFKKDT
jgi:T4 RnlA family RNA ligase